MAEAPFAYAAVVLVVALIAGLMPVFSKIKQNPERLKMITSIAAGIIISSAILVIIPEGFALATEDDHGHGDTLIIGGALLAGFLLMLILEGSGIGHAIHEEHHDHSDEHGHSHVHHSAPGWMLVLGLTLHSATDGIAIGAAAATGSAALTATILLAIVIHKAPVAFSLGIFSMHERETRNETIRDVVIFALSTPVMMILAFYALTGLEMHTIGLAMLFSAGTFLYIATVDTLPDIHNPETGKKAMIYLLVGVAILVGLLVVGDLLEIGHAH